MVEREVNINGQRQKVLVPQVYLISRHTDIGSSGAIISANQIKGKVAGTLTNRGRLSGVVSTDLKANILTNRYGTIEGGTVDLHTTQELNNLGGRIWAGSRLKATSDGEINLTSTTLEGSLAELKGEKPPQKRNRLLFAPSEDHDRLVELVDSMSELGVEDLQGQLEVHAKSNINTKATLIRSEGRVLLHSDQSIILDEITQKDYLKTNRDNMVFANGRSWKLDTDISAVNDITISGKKGIEVRGGYPHSEKGEVIYHSEKGNVNLEKARVRGTNTSKTIAWAMAGAILDMETYTPDMVLKAQGDNKLEELQRKTLEQFEREHANFVAALKAGKTLGGIAVENIPLLGDRIAFAQAKDWTDYGLAAIGLIPGADSLTKPLKEAKKDVYRAYTGALKGEFSIIDWTGYPPGYTKPSGPFRLLDDAEYDLARKQANTENRKIRLQNDLIGKERDIHEIHPVKFGGDPVSSSNKDIIDRTLHRKELTPWWNDLQKYIEKNQTIGDK